MSRSLPRISILSAASSAHTLLCLTDACCHWHIQLHLVSQEPEGRRTWQQWEHGKQCYSFGVESDKRKTSCLILQHLKSKRCLQWRFLLLNLTQGIYFIRLVQIKVLCFQNFMKYFFRIWINREKNLVFEPKHIIASSSQKDVKWTNILYF